MGAGPAIYQLAVGGAPIHSIGVGGAVIVAFLGAVLVAVSAGQVTLGLGGQ